ncbi:uncharacterized protein KGF55_005196 [Candida pseudojiufengensis]|uniref:uncharacterized protein n=1 Tax=Candida pseudojiufengensis TaxID=497109 RepID=UPI0022242580|nr:uncharacterized protein KGF55_005196 [Candida pseudojiufengensis]KAI5959552.1 hypothetical protein KGF55_005196 [Candida pseudojiufengensis]
MSLFRGHNIPKSSRILLFLLITITSTLFILKYKTYNSLKLQDSTKPINFHDINIPFIQLIPNSTIYNPWSIITSIFAEISILSFIFSFIILFIGSKFIERFWGYIEVIKFILVVGSITNFITVLIAILINIARSDSENMNKPLGGGISYYFGFLVVFKQLIPEHNIVLFQGLINFRIKHLPFASLIILTIWSIGFGTLYPALPSITSFFISYFYLRFYQSLKTDSILPSNNQDSLLVGDASDTFQLVEFFPNLLKPYLTPVFNQIYEIAILLALVQPFNDEIIQQSNSRAQKRQEQVNQINKSVASSVAERRRQIALQVIEDRINKESGKV